MTGVTEGYSFRLTARVLLYAPLHRQDNTYHGLCYTSRGALVGGDKTEMNGESQTEIISQEKSGNHRFVF